MIQQQSYLDIADNTGAKQAMCIKVLRGSSSKGKFKRKVAHVGDVVMVMAGADKGRTGRVMRVVTNKGRVVVEGVNRVWKHVRPSQRNPQGGRIQKDAAIHLSNVMPLDPATGKGTRVRFEERDGA